MSGRIAVPNQRLARRCDGRRGQQREQCNGAERDERNGPHPSHEQRCLALIDEVLVADGGRCLREVSRESGAAVDLPAPLVVVVDEDRKP